MRSLSSVPGYTNLAAEVTLLRSELDVIKDAMRSHGIEVADAIDARSAPPLSAADATPDGASVSTGPSMRQLAGSDRKRYGAPPPSEEPQPPDTPGWIKERLAIDWDAVIGGNWLARIGVLAVVIGMGFFLKLAFDNEWVGETGRIAIGIAIGAVLIGAGEYWRSKYVAYSRALSGGGVAILYLAIYASFAIYELIGIYPATGLLLLLSVAVAMLAVVRDSVALAVLGIIGGFGAPFLLGIGGDTDSSGTSSTANAISLLVYIGVVNVGVIVLSTFRKWQWFLMLAKIGALGAFGLWYLEFMDSGELEADAGVKSAVLIAQAGMTSIWVAFVSASTLFHLIWRRRPTALDMIVMFANASGYALISFGIMWDEFRVWMGIFTLSLAVFYVAVGYVALLRIGLQQIDHKKPSYDALLTYILLGIAAVFVTIAVPVQVGAPWVSIAWVVEAIVILWIGRENRLKDIRSAAVVLFAIALGWVVFVDTPFANDRDPGLFHNSSALSYLFVAAGIFGTAYLLARWKGELSRAEKFLYPAAIVAGFGVLVIAVPSQVEGPWMVFSWTALGLAATAFGLRTRLLEATLVGVGVFVIAALVAMAEESSVPARDYTVLINSRLLAFGPLIAAVGISAVGWYRWPFAETKYLSRVIMVALIIAANWLALWFLTAEVIEGVQTGELVDVASSNEDSVISLGLTALWGVYGAVVLAIGVIGGWRRARLGGLALLAIPVIKLFLVDSFLLEAGYRVASFMIMGLLLMIGGYLYQRHNEAFREFFLKQQTESESA
ncbi:MAG: DUF2339 domain-containing protein [Chloroflexi bacterium]|nr:DUF2339 domain-containing protein [Chloroflexota bacterium]